MEHDVIIIGLGPSGATAALMLSGTGLKIAVIEKSSFPRDKICGDALSGNVVNTLKKLPGDVYSKFLNDFSLKLPSYGIRFIAPNHKHLDIPFTIPNFQNPNSNSETAAGYTARRADFDNFLFRQLKSHPNISIFENTKINDVIISDSSVIAISEKRKFEGKIIIGADGFNSVVTRKVFPERSGNDNLCTGLRAYYKNVSGFSDTNFIELYFFNEILPGYFWIFPLPGNTANVGIGMLTSHLKAKKINLKALTERIIRENPAIFSRFDGSQLIDDFKAYTLPLWNSKKDMSFHRCLLTGDAASLVDPFTGEGVGNAMYSGRLAAEQVIKSFENNDFSASFLKNYDLRFYKSMSDELRISRIMQKLSKRPMLMNLVVSKANRNKPLHDTIISMINNIDVKKQLTSPAFYIKLLLNRG